MQTLKKGSRGSDVKKLQELLFMDNCDGIFGPGTEAAVVEFQATHGITPIDGVVGPKTLSALLAVPATALSGMPSLGINYQPAASICTKKANRSIKYIVVHYTMGASSAAGKALATRRDWLGRPKGKQASADFVVDDQEIVQINPDLRNYYCWSVGGSIYSGYGGALLHGIATNANTISIEICSTHRKGYDITAGNHDGWYFTDTVLDKAVDLVRHLMKEFSIPIERVIRHYDVNGKACPGIPGWNDAPLFDAKTGKKLATRNNSEAWQAFKRRLR